MGRGSLPRAARRGARAAVVATALLLTSGASLPIASAAGASEKAKLNVSFTPDRLGAATSIATGIEIAAAPGAVPPAVTGFDLYLPSGAEIGSSSLGLAVCGADVLATQGPEGCPSNARIGSGSAIVAVPFGPELVEETAGIVAVMGTPKDEQVVMLLYAEARTPILAQLILPGELLPDTGAFGERLASTIPVTPTLPGAGDVSMIDLKLNIDPPGLLYEKRVGGRTVDYHPRGVELPRRCPRKGFPFAATLYFQGGDTITAKRTVPCPPRAGRR